MAVTVDGVKQDEMPTNPMGKDNKYYQVDVSCTSSKMQGLWDYNAWRLNLDYIESNSKCNLEFTSTLSKEEYDEYIKSGVSLRRNTYRGKNITELWKNGDLYTQIADGTFADIYVGDYIVSEHADESGKNIVWLIADLDNYLGVGNQGNGLEKHHATIIPAYKLQDSRMNDTDTTEGGYKGSEMYRITLDSVFNQYIAPDFEHDEEKHVIEYLSYVSISMNQNRSNMFGETTGASSSGAWETRKLDLMSEVNIYGTTIWSSSGYDVGIDNRQYAIFQLRPELISQELSGQDRTRPRRYWYWLKALADSKCFVFVSNDGVVTSYMDSTEESGGVRPRFLIG